MNLWDPSAALARILAGPLSLIVSASDPSESRQTVIKELTPKEWSRHEAYWAHAWRAFAWLFVLCVGGPVAFLIYVAGDQVESDIVRGIAAPLGAFAYIAFPACLVHSLRGGVAWMLSPTGGSGKREERKKPSVWTRPSPLDAYVGILIAVGVAIEFYTSIA